MMKFMTAYRWYYLLRWSIILILGLAIYYQTFSFGFVFDDDWFIVTSPHIRDSAHLMDAFNRLPLTRFIGILSFAMNYAIDGLNPRGYHIFNFMIHLIATGLVWGVSRQLFNLSGAGQLTKKGPQELRKWSIYEEMPFFIALLFLVHPGQTQAVTYITQRFESLATVFYLATLYCYLLARVAQGARKMALFVLAGVLAVLGILTKEVVATIPLMLVAVEVLVMPVIANSRVMQRKQSIYNHSRRKLLFVLMVGAVCFSLLFMKLVRTDLGIFVQTLESESHDGDWLTGGNYFLTQMRVFLTFVRLLIVPVHQNLDYDYPMSTGLLQPPLTMVGMCLIGGMVVLIIRLRRQYPLISFGLAWMLITFSINLAPRANVIFEHKLYLISFGFFLAALSTAAIWIRSRKVFFGLVTAIVLILSMVSFQRNHVWKDDVTLWEDVIQKSPNKKRVRVNMGLEYSRAHRYEDALTLLNKFMTPKDLKSYTARGQIYFEIGKEDLALKDFNHVLSLDKTNVDAYIRRAKVYKRQKNVQAALVDLAEAIRLQPDNEKPYIDRSIIWMSQAKTEEALKDIQQALKIDPHHFGALVDSAGIYLHMNSFELAIEQLNKAQVINSSDVRVYKNRALCFLALGQIHEAMKDMEIVLRLNPHDQQVYAKYQELLNRHRLP